MSIISSVFFAADFDKISFYIMKLFPDNGKQTISKVKVYALDILKKYVKGYLLLMVITFVELALGLSIIKFENSILIAAIIAFVDILPVIGTGGVMIPWIILELLLGIFFRIFHFQLS